MDGEESLRRLREELEAMGYNDLTPEMLLAIDADLKRDGFGEVGGDLTPALVDEDEPARPGPTGPGSRHVSVSERRVNGKKILEIRDLDEDGVERVYDSLDDAPEDVRAFIEWAESGASPGALFERMRGTIDTPPRAGRAPGKPAGAAMLVAMIVLALAGVALWLVIW